MTAIRQLSADAVKFRRLIIDALWDDRQFGYVTEDIFVGSCAVCDAPVGVHFAYGAPRAVLHCHGGCTEAEIANRIGLEVRP